MDAAFKKGLKAKILTLLLLFLLLFVGLVSRAFQLQILSADYLQNLAKKQHTKVLMLHPERGVIFDRNGEKLAASLMADSIFADPSKIADPNETADKISAILYVDKTATLKKISTAKSFCWLARKAAPEVAGAVEGADIPGIYVVKEPKRFYPNGTLAGHVLGFVGLDDTGLEGLESGYDEQLKGTPKKLIWSQDAKKKKLNSRIDDSAIDQSDSGNLILTIDSRIQHLAEMQLKEAVESKSAKGGIVIIMDPRTGEILAMANEMEFDPNNFSDYSTSTRKNRAITDCYDPGSTFKPFLAAGALEEGILKETDKLYCENGHYAVANRIIHEAQRKRHGFLTFSEVLKYSSNIGSVKISEKLGKDKFYQYIKKFGFGIKTGIDLPGESPGLLRPSQQWTRVDASTIAFGQGISVTAIQLITALSAIANDGVLMKPFLVRAIVNRKGETLRSYRPTVIRRVVSSSTAKRLAAILTDVVGAEDGTGKRARIENVAVAGKTGTSQKFDFARHVFSSEKVRTSFMGFFPADNPQIAMIVILDEPERDKWGGVASAPVFKNIGEQILTCFRTPLKNEPLPLGKEELDETGLKLVSTIGMALPKQIQPIGEDDMESSMPDFHGMTIRDVLRKARKTGIEINIRGSGWAKSQEPAAGTPIGDYPLCTVSFEN
jgi:cell division protein FtsI (penicillin-binding protein 3)